MLGIHGWYLGVVCIALSKVREKSIKTMPHCVDSQSKYSVEYLRHSRNQFCRSCHCPCNISCSRLVPMQVLGLKWCEQSRFHWRQLWDLSDLHCIRLSVLFIGCCLQLWIRILAELVLQLCLCVFIPPLQSDSIWDDTLFTGFGNEAINWFFSCWWGLFHNYNLYDCQGSEELPRVKPCRVFSPLL